MRALLLLVTVLVGLGFSKAQAAPLVEVTCYHDDCFKSGWIAEYPRAGFWAQSICWKKDCGTYGWQVHDSRGVDTDVTCVGRGCFVDGWIESVAYGRQSQYFKCKAPAATPENQNPTPACWTHGFEATGPSVFSDVTCLNGDCAKNGWITKARGQRDVTTVCKAKADEATGQMVSDCFRFGWNVYQ